MPMYDFECPHGHVFERNVPIAEMNNIIPCEGKVNELLNDDEIELVEEIIAGPYHSREDLEKGRLTISGIGEVGLVAVHPDETSLMVKKVPCILKARRIISHSNPSAILDHGHARNRDAAREGRYDPLRPATNVMSKGRSWRK